MGVRFLYKPYTPGRCSKVYERSKDMKILISTSEAIPFVKTGGLADVTGALLKEYRKMDVDAYLVLPLYSAIRDAYYLTDTGRRLTVPVGDRRYNSRIWSYGSEVYLIECNEFFERPELYGTPEGDYPDNAARFTFYCRAVLEACMAVGIRPDVIHCNDWQTGLIPLYLRTIYNTEFFSRTATIMTIHNLGYQGLFNVSDFPLTGLGWEWFNPEGVEFYGKVNLLKAGLIASDIITTVSPTYAREILTDEYGFGLDGVLRKRSSDLFGVINGIDNEEWNPARDRSIPANYNLSDISGKAICRKALIDECSLSKNKDAPLIALIGRLSSQKGLDILLESVDDIVSMGARLIVLGKGDEHYHRGILGAAERYKGRVYARVGYDEAFARRIYAGSDIFLMPSRYEPCGLGQLIAMRYGTIPVARKTGGLADTIIDYNPLKGDGTGFLFEDYKASALRECLRSALSVFVDKRRWKMMVTNAMKIDFSWESSAKRYMELYDIAIKKKRV
ncbi:MAG: glycogen synthase GlgA [Thermodesulfovibrionales bacterium]